MKILDAILKPLRPLLLGLWLGAAIFFGAAVAPNLFGVLRAANLANANELAAAIVTRLLAIINFGGFFIFSFFALSVYIFLKDVNLILGIVVRYSHMKYSFVHG